MATLKNKLTRQFIKGIAKEGKDILIQAYDDFVEKLLEDKPKEEEKKEITFNEKWEMLKAIDPEFEIRKNKDGLYYTSYSILVLSTKPEGALQTAWNYGCTSGIIVGDKRFKFDGEKFVDINLVKEKPKSWQENVAQL